MKYGPKVYYFVIDRAELVAGFSTNQVMLNALNDLLSDPDIYPHIDSLIVTSAASPIGSRNRNDKLSMERANSLKNYIGVHHPQINAREIHTQSVGIDWEGFWWLIETTPNVPNKEKILALKGIRDENLVLSLLRTVGGKETYNYLLHRVYPQLQYAAVRAVLDNGYSIPLNGSPLKQLCDTVWVNTVVRDTVWLTHPDAHLYPYDGKRKPFLMAVKTNLLYDAALLPNLAIEIPFGRNYAWSAEVEGHWSWWNTNHSSYYYHRVQMAGVELRRWLGNRQQRRPLSGWYVGLYGYGGTYDIRLFTNKDTDLGQLSDLSYSGGLSVGYTMPIHRRWNLEFGLAAGYFGGEYKKYNHSSCADNVFPWISTHNRHYFGLTKAKVSLVWLIGSVNQKRRRGEL